MNTYVKFKKNIFNEQKCFKIKNEKVKMYNVIRE